MEIIPAIDIIEGKCVRLVKGDYKTKKVYNLNPLKMAKDFERAGLKWLHLIDLDGAKSGKIKNWKTIRDIARKTRLLIQVGGGIKNQRDIEKLLGLGIKRVILGTIAVREPEKVRAFLQKFGPEKIAVALDIKKDKICYRGWQKEAKKELSSFLRNLMKWGVKTIIVTDIERDGSLGGPNFSLYKKLVKNSPNLPRPFLLRKKGRGLEIIASGGIRNLEDLKKLAKIGVAGVIVGKAIYEKKISLNELKSMMPKKIIPCLDCKMWKAPKESKLPTGQGKWSVVKGIKFEKLRLAGDPVKLAKKYLRDGADELAMLDISASLEKRKPFFDLVKRVSAVIGGRIHLIVGGGISTISDIEKILKAGANKVSINTAVVKNPDFLNKAVKKFGSQKIVVAIDYKKIGKNWGVCIFGGTKITDLDAILWAKGVEKKGAGELLPTSKDRDGTKKGYDIEFLRKLKENVSIPVIASGGAGKKSHFYEVLKKGGADAVLAASLFHFGEIKIPELRKYLKEKGINVS